MRPDSFNFGTIFLKFYIYRLQIPINLWASRNFAKIYLKKLWNGLMYVHMYYSGGGAKSRIEGCKFWVCIASELQITKISKCTSSENRTFLKIDHLNRPNAAHWARIWKNIQTSIGPLDFSLWKIQRGDPSMSKIFASDFDETQNLKSLWLRDSVHEIWVGSETKIFLT